MKKLFIMIFVCTLIGFGLGYFVVSEYKIENEKEIKYLNKESIYLLQVGAYEKESNVTKATKNLPFYLVSKEGELFHIYVGIVKNKENLDKIKEFYKVFDNKIYIRETSISNKEFLDLLSKYESVIIESKEANVIFSAQKELLKKFKELKK